MVGVRSTIRYQWQKGQGINCPFANQQQTTNNKPLTMEKPQIKLVFSNLFYTQKYQVKPLLSMVASIVIIIRQANLTDIEAFLLFLFYGLAYGLTE